MTFRPNYPAAILTDDATGKLGFKNAVTANDEVVLSYDKNTGVGVGTDSTSTIAVGAAVSLTTATAANVTSLSLAAGSWDVSGVVDFALGAATTTDWAAGISTTSATLGGQDQNIAQPLVLTTHTDTYQLGTPTVRLTLAAATTVYLVAQSTFSAGTVGVYGTLSARMVRGA